jgi:hypothetical protein
VSVTDSLTTRDRELAAWISDQGVLTPFLLVAAMRKVDGLRPQTALALVNKEVGGDGKATPYCRNIFGCDWGAKSSAPWCRQEVTEARYKALRALGKPNGVGPTQLTSFGFCDIADRRGGCWKPYYNMWTGFEIIDRLIEDHGYRNGANRYNGGDSLTGQRNGEAAGYGEGFVILRTRWEKRLLAAGFKVA